MNDLDFNDLLNFVGLASQAIEPIASSEATDGQEPSAESRRQNQEPELPPRPLSDADKLASKRLAAQLDKEFWGIP